MNQYQRVLALHDALADVAGLHSRYEELHAKIGPDDIESGLEDADQILDTLSSIAGQVSNRSKALSIALMAAIATLTTKLDDLKADAATLAEARREQSSFLYDADDAIEQIGLAPPDQLWRYDDYPWPGAEPEPLL
jgi:uncharacterized membrane protein YccC